MKKNINILQIKGLTGILYLGFIGLCLIAGFCWFPGWMCMKAWNLLSAYFVQLPVIGIFQGILLWAIVAVSYFTFRKDRHVVFMNASEGLSEEELRAVFADMQKHAKDDVFFKSVLKSREAELKIKNLSESNIPKTNAVKDKLQK